jgi:hypothetical protein
VVLMSFFQANWSAGNARRTSSMGGRAGRARLTSSIGAALQTAGAAWGARGRGGMTLPPLRCADRVASNSLKGGAPADSPSPAKLECEDLDFLQALDTLPSEGKFVFPPGPAMDTTAERMRLDRLNQERFFFMAGFRV